MGDTTIAWRVARRDQKGHAMYPTVRLIYQLDKTNQAYNRHGQTQMYQSGLCLLAACLIGLCIINNTLPKILSLKKFVYGGSNWARLKYNYVTKN